MKKRLFKGKTNKPSFWHRKTTVRSVIFAVVFVLLSPFLLVPNTAYAVSLDFGALASGALDSAFKGATDYAAGSVFGYVTSKLGPGFSSLVDQRQRWQGLYKPAMKEFMNEMDRQWVSSVPGFFTTTLFYPEAAFEAIAGNEHESFQEARNYAGPVENTWKLMSYYNNQSAAQSSYQEAQQDIEEATESEGINVLKSGGDVAKDITASQALDSAAAAVVVGGGGGGGGGTLETIESVARIASTVATVISLVI